MTFDQYPATVAEVLRLLPLMPLGPGEPREMRPRLEAATGSGADSVFSSRTPSRPLQNYLANLASTFLDQIGIAPSL